jgi:glycosyltransferase involved in cell wall biosynthesis
MPAKVSIILPTYNRPQYVAEAVRSVLSQTYRDWELLLWDDGSTEPVLPILREFESADPRVCVIAAEHAGEQLARQRAIARSTGEYVGWMDSDDRLAPTALEETVTVLDVRPDVGMVYSDHSLIDSAGNTLGVGARCAIPYSPERLLLDFMTFHFRLMRRTVYERTGGYSSPDPAAADYDFCLRLSELTAIYHLPKPLYFYRSHPDQISQTRTLAQILASKDAISRALHRRGLADRMSIEVQLKGTFKIVKRVTTEIT